MKHFVLVLSIVMGAALLGSCESFRRFLGINPQKPKVSLRSVHVERYGLSRLGLSIKVAAENPNSFDIKFSKLSYQLLLNDKVVADGEFENVVTIKGQERTKITIPLLVEAGSALKILGRGIYKKEPVHASWNGSALFHSPVGKMRVKFQEQKELRL